MEQDCSDETPAEPPPPPPQHQRGKVWVQDDGLTLCSACSRVCQEAVWTLSEKENTQQTEGRREARGRQEAGGEGEGGGGSPEGGEREVRNDLF